MTGAIAGQAMGGGRTSVQGVGERAVAEWYGSFVDARRSNAMGRRFAGEYVSAASRQARSGFVSETNPRCGDLRTRIIHVTNSADSAERVLIGQSYIFRGPHLARQVYYQVEKEI